MWVILFCLVWKEQTHTHIIQLDHFVQQLAAVVFNSNWRTLYVCWTVSSSRLMHICCSQWETGTIIVDFGDFLGFDANNKTFNCAFNGHKWVIPDWASKEGIQPSTLTSSFPQITFFVLLMKVNNHHPLTRCRHVLSAVGLVLLSVVTNLKPCSQTE